MVALAAAAIGVGLTAAGVIGGSATAKKQAAEQKAIAADQMKIEEQKRMAMELVNRGYCAGDTIWSRELREHWSEPNHRQTDQRLQ